MHNPHTKINMLTQMTDQTVGEYTIKDRLGGSAYSAVYSAYNHRTKQPVALKILMPDADSVTRRRFYQEAQTTLGLNHHNIVRTFDAKQVDESGLFYIIMEHVDGISLSEFMEEQCHLSLADAANLLEPIARALAYAHSKDIIHRDVKPSNILLKRVPEGTPHSIQLSALEYPVIPQLSDFGIARVLDAPDLTNTGRTIGTPAYMAPEQCNGKRQIDGRADIYSLGTVLYRCLVGHPPFIGSTTNILHAHVYEPLKIPDQMVDKLPGRAIRMLKKTLMKEPEQRYHHAGHLADDLAVIAGKSGASRNLAMPVNKSAETATMSSVIPVISKGQAAMSVLVPGSLPRTIVSPKTRTSRASGSYHGTSARTVTVSGPSLASIQSQSAKQQSRTQKNQPVAKYKMPQKKNRNLYMGSAAGAAAALVFVFLFSYYTFVPEWLGDVVGQLPTLEAPAIEEPSAASVPQIALDTPPEILWENVEQIQQVKDNWRFAYENLLMLHNRHPEFKSQDVETLLFDITLDTAREYYVQNDIEAAQRIVNFALSLNVDDREAERTQLSRQLTATVQYLNTTDIDVQDAAIADIFNTYLSYYDHLHAVQDYCRAYEVFQPALTLMPLTEHYLYGGRLGDALGLCIASPTSPESLRMQNLSGRILYTSQNQDGRNAAAVKLGFQEESSLAAGFQSVVVDQYVIRFSQAIYDQNMQQISWNPANSQIAYVTSSPGISPQIYWSDNSNSQQATPIAVGQDPAWNQRGDLIAYSGLAENPGIWQFYTESSVHNQLTTNGSDRHPVWIPDKTALVFMSYDRDGNWELYLYNKLKAEGKQITRLTNDTANDGLPTVSPDGNYLAYLSDRGGKWQVWVMPLQIDADQIPQPQLLFDVKGQMPDWLQETMQWIP